MNNGIAARGKILAAEERGIRVEYAGGKIVYHRREDVVDVQREDDPALAEYEALRKKGDETKAEEALRRTIAAQPAGWLAERYRVEAMELQLAGGRFAEAVATYAALLQANPDSARWTRMPVPVYGPRENREARRILEDALRGSGIGSRHSWYLRMLMGSVLAASERPEDAGAYLNALRASHDAQALRLAPLLGAEIAISKKQYREAAAALEKEMRSLPEALKPRSCFWLGTAYEGCGEHAPASAAFLRVPLTFQNESPALQSECLYQGASACEKAGLKEQAASLRKELKEKFSMSYRARNSEP